MVAVLGQHTVAFRSKSQSVIALSTGEAEFYALVGAISSGMGLVSVLADFGIDLPLVVRTDASAGLGTASRRGLGRTKHIHVQYLWIQNLIADGLITLQKISGDINRSDLLAKHLAATRMKRLLGDMNFKIAGGSSNLALQAADVGAHVGCLSRHSGGVNTDSGGVRCCDLLAQGAVKTDERCWQWQWLSHLLFNLHGSGERG